MKCICIRGRGSSVTRDRHANFSLYKGLRCSMAPRVVVKTGVPEEQRKHDRKPQGLLSDGGNADD